MRFISAQLHAPASTATFGARRPARQRHGHGGSPTAVAAMPGSRLYPVQANAVFAAPAGGGDRAAARAVHFYVWDEEAGVVRWMCSWQTTPSGRRRARRRAPRGDGPVGCEASSERRLQDPGGARASCGDARSGRGPDRRPGRLRRAPAGLASRQRDRAHRSGRRGGHAHRRLSGAPGGSPAAGARAGTGSISAPAPGSRASRWPSLCRGCT